MSSKIGSENVSLFSFLRQLPLDELSALYKCEWSARAVVESLSQIQQQILLRLVLRFNVPASKEFILSWFHGARGPQRLALDSIQQVRWLRYGADAKQILRAVSRRVRTQW